MRTSVSIIIYFAAFGSVIADVLRVPSQFTEIQAAVNAADDWDTVLVDPGLYAEAILTPRSVVIIGNVSADSNGSDRPIIDPSTLTNPSTRACLFLQGGPVIMEDFVFRNGPQMYPRNTGTGGVRNTAAGSRFTRCLFDSTYGGIHSLEQPVTIRHCEFRNTVSYCVNASLAELRAEFCLFTGHAHFAMVECGSHSVLENCVTRDVSGNGDMWWIAGTNITVRNCVFGPARLYSGPAVWGIFLNNSLFENNLFMNIVLGSGLIGAYNCACDSPVVLRGNQFIDNFGRDDQGHGGNSIGIGCDEFGFCYTYLAEFNTFLGGVSRSGGSKALSIGQGDTVRYNRFINMHPLDRPAVKGRATGPECHDNFFQGNGIAASADTQLFGTLDASRNWWGDSSGPYHPTLNPRGLGDAVTNGVTFDPWYRDTSFFQINEADYRAPLPEQFMMLVYPNPFNSVAQIEITPSRAVIIEVELFDLLGRKVRTVWDGPVGVRSRISFNASELSSGVYFVRAWDILGRKSLAMEKIVLLK